MQISKHITSLVLALIILVSLSISYQFSKDVEKPYIFITKQESSFNLDAKFWNYFHLGQKRLISSLLWVSTLLESDQDHYKKNDLNSWMFLRFQTISLLEPLFYETYNFGGLYLSIIKDDLAGATVLYNKGLEFYPKDFNLLKNASFHFYFEVQDYKAAYDVLKRLKELPNIDPIMLNSLARIESQNGNLQDAYDLLAATYNSLKDKNGFLAKKINLQLYSIKAEIDLTCLNSKKINCSYSDYEGNQYIRQKDGSYKAFKKWEEFRIKRKAGGEPPPAQ